MKKNKKISIKSKLLEYKFENITLTILSSIIIFTILFASLLPQKVDIKLGEPAQRDIKATRDVIDKVATQKLKLEAMEAVEQIYNIDSSIQIQIKSDIRMYFKTLRELQLNESKSFEQKLDELNSQNYVKIDSETNSLLLRTEQEKSIILEENIYNTLSEVMNDGITKEEVENSKVGVKNIINSLNNIPNNLKEAGEKIINSKLIANKFPDVQNTEKEKEKAAELVEPVVIKEGELIVAKNANIDRSIYSILDKAGLITTTKSAYIKLFLGCLLLTLVIELSMKFFIRYFEKEVLKDIKKMSVMVAITVLIISISKMIFSISPYLMPIATVSIIVSIISNERLGILFNILTVILIGILTSIDMPIVFMFLITGIIGSFACRNIQQRSNVIFIGGLIALVNMSIILGFGLSNDLYINVLLKRIGFGIINGALCALISIGTLPIWENLFGVLTPLKLLEIMNPNNPLLKRLLMEAPGTYYHSILVGNLAERAANEIGANALLVRVASYYHDIGKLKRPFFFKENQTDMENPHDNISPTLSALIITSHTKDGVKFAKEYNIPKEIYDMMIEHHGTTLVSYFYHKAKELDGNVEEKDFRYDGVKPQSKEAGIIMIADSIEAACRSLKVPTEDSLRELIRCIINAKLKDGQLDESGLTLKDLKTMETSFVDTISGIYHDRIEYPKMESV